MNSIIFVLMKNENGSHRPEHHTRVKSLLKTHFYRLAFMWCCVFTVFLSFSPFIYLFIYLYCHFTAFVGSSFYLLFLLCCQSTLSTLFLESTISIKFIIVFIYQGWFSAVCQRSAVLLWLQLWGQTPLIWENWIWATTTCRTQQWRSFVVFYRVQPVDWRLWGQFTDFCRSHIYKTAFIPNWSHFILI